MSVTTIKEQGKIWVEVISTRFGLHIGTDYANIKLPNVLSTGSWNTQYACFVPFDYNYYMFKQTIHLLNGDKCVKSIFYFNTL